MLVQERGRACRVGFVRATAIDDHCITKIDGPYAIMSLMQPTQGVGDDTVRVRVVAQTSAYVVGAVPSVLAAARG